MTEELYIYNIYYVSQSKNEWKMSKENEVKTIYNSIYYVSQSKFEWKNK